MDIEHVKKESAPGVIVCVARLPSYFSSADLRKLTEPHAHVLRCWMAQHPRGLPLGFGYVEVPTSTAVEAVITGLSGVVLDGKPLFVEILKTA